MIVKVNVGGVDIYFGGPQAPVKPVPFYPYLLDVGTIQDTTGDETGATSFKLLLKAQPLLWLNLRRPVHVLSDSLEQLFEGVIGRIAYTEDIAVTVEA